MLEPLFLDTKKSKSSKTQMPDAVSEWTDFIINQLYSQHPSLTGKAAEVVFQSKDEEQGYATGAVKISDRGVTIMQIPFVIEARKIYPMDVFFSSKKDDKPHPLTKDRIREVFFHARILDGLAPPPRAGDLTNAGLYYGADENLSSYNYRIPPTMGIDKWGEAKTVEDKVVSFFNNISSEGDLLKEALDRATLEAIKSFSSDIMTMDGAVSIKKMQKLGTAEGLQQIALAEEGAPPASLFKEAIAMEKVAVESVRVVKRGVDLYDLYLKFDSPDYDIEKVANVQLPETQRIVESISSTPEQDFRIIERSGERIISAIRNDPDDYSNITDIDPIRYEDAPNGGIWKVNVYNPKNRTSMKGFCCGNVIFPSGKATGGKLFFNPQVFAFQKKIAVEKLDGTVNDTGMNDIRFSFPKPGEWGTFMSQDDKDRGTCLIPFKVLTTVRDDSVSPSTMAIRVESRAGNKFTLIPSDNVVSFRPVKTATARKYMGILADKETAYLIPKRFQYITLGEPRKFAESVDETTKEAAAKDTVTDPIKITCDIDRFIVKGGEAKRFPFEKWGYVNGALGEMELFHSLLTMGVAGTDASEAVKTASEAGVSYLYHTRKPYEQSSDMAKSLKKEATFDLVARELNGLQKDIKNVNLLKIAANTPDVATVNNVLSLRFLGPETIQHFVSGIPTLEDTVSFLSGLLLASRLDSGMELDDSEISSGIRLVDSVIQKLKKMKSVLLPT